jgi:hypothetical protein
MATHGLLLGLRLVTQPHIVPEIIIAPRLDLKPVHATRSPLHQPRRVRFVSLFTKNVAPRPSADRFCRSPSATNYSESESHGQSRIERQDTVPNLETSCAIVGPFKRHPIQSTRNSHPRYIHDRGYQQPTPLIWSDIPSSPTLNGRTLNASLPPGGAPGRKKLDILDPTFQTITTLSSRDAVTSLRPSGEKLIAANRRL